MEVQQHLPIQSFTFSSVDKDWRELIESATANPSVMTVCLKEGDLCIMCSLCTVRTILNRLMIHVVVMCLAP